MAKTHEITRTDNSLKLSADKIVMLPVSEVRPYDKNPRKNADAVKFVKASIEQFGFKVPIIVDSNRVIVCGHTRLLAAKSLGMSEVPCIMASDLTDEQIKAFRLADNKVAEFSEWEMNLLGGELGELAEISDIDMGDFGFADDGISADDFGDEFSLPDGEKSNITQWTLTFAEEQKAFIESALKEVCEPKETFGNVNESGNKIYEVVRQWAELKKSN